MNELKLWLEKLLQNMGLSAGAIPYLRLFILLFLLVPAADIFDHILASASFFDLDIFQQSGGSDLARALNNDEK